MATETASFVYIAPVLVGVIAGFLELIFVHGDEPGMGWLGHGMHALPMCIVFSFISMNVSFVYNYLPGSITENLLYDIGIRALIGLIAAIKIKTAAAITKGHGSVGEKLPHALIIGAVIAGAPYVWPMIAPMLPKILQK